MIREISNTIIDTSGNNVILNQIYSLLTCLPLISEMRTFVMIQNSAFQDQYTKVTKLVDLMCHLNQVVICVINWLNTLIQTLILLAQL